MSKGQRREGISQELDVLAGELLAAAMDLLAEGETLDVLLVVEDASGATDSYVFSDDSPELCLEAAHEKVIALRGGGGRGSSAHKIVRYAICYEGAVADEQGIYHDAVILEFGERGYRSYSGYSFFEGRGMGDGLLWTDPAPAGELESLL